MRRLFLSFSLIYACIFVVLFIYVELGVTAHLRTYFEPLLGRGNVAPLVVGVPFVVLIGVWVAIGFVQLSPKWRFDLNKSLPQWPVRGRPYLNHSIHGLTSCIAVAMIVSRAVV